MDTFGLGSPNCFVVNLSSLVRRLKRSFCQRANRIIVLHRHIFNSYALELREQRLTNEESIRQNATDKMASMTYPSRYEPPSRYKTHPPTASVWSLHVSSP